MFNLIASWRREREAVRELSRMSDRELADLGIARSDIPSLVGGGHHAEASRRERADDMAPSWGCHIRGSVGA